MWWPMLVRDHVGLREVARRIEAVRELAEEAEVDVHVLVGRAVERARSATCRRRSPCRLRLRKSTSRAGANSRPALLKSACQKLSAGRRRTDETKSTSSRFARPGRSASCARSRPAAAGRGTARTGCRRRSRLCRRAGRWAGRRSPRRCRRPAGARHGRPASSAGPRRSLQGLRDASASRRRYPVRPGHGERDRRALGLSGRAWRGRAGCWRRGRSGGGSWPRLCQRAGGSGRREAGVSRCGCPYPPRPHQAEPPETVPAGRGVPRTTGTQNAG